MPINAYTGLMGSGKSYEVVASVIVPAIKAGRRVVTNVDGIDGDAIAAYCFDKFGTPLDKCGKVIHASNEQVKGVDFLPYGEEIDTLVRSGDLVCIDEAWRFWGTLEKILKEHAIFFREHRHYADPETGVTCDLVVMVQDISDLHRQLKAVVELSFRTKKIKALGLNKTYTIQMWEGYKQTAKTVASTSTKKYDPEIFPLYNSYAGGKGKEVAVDARQNVLANPKVWMMVGGIVLMFAISIWYLVKVFSPSPPSPRSDQAVRSDKAVSSGSSSSAAPSPAAAPVPSQPGQTPVSSAWRIAGRIARDGVSYVVLQNADGRLRLEHPSAFVFNDGRPVAGTIDGQRVTVFGGQFPAVAGSSSSQPVFKP